MYWHALTTMPGIGVLILLAAAACAVAFTRGPWFILGALLTSLRWSGAIPEPWDAIVSTAATACLFVGLQRVIAAARAQKLASTGSTPTIPKAG